MCWHTPSVYYQECGAVLVIHHVLVMLFFQQSNGGHRWYMYRSMLSSLYILLIECVWCSWCSRCMECIRCSWCSRYMVVHAHRVKIIPKLMVVGIFGRVVKVPLTLTCQACALHWMLHMCKLSDCVML